jgi:hypothetical protein
MTLGFEALTESIFFISLKAFINYSPFLSLVDQVLLSKTNLVFLMEKFLDHFRNFKKFFNAS